jgi:hypothetical protein
MAREKIFAEAVEKGSHPDHFLPVLSGYLIKKIRKLPESVRMG